MNHEIRMDIYRRIRMLEYDASSEQQLRNDIDSSVDFTRDEKDFLYCCMNKFKPYQTAKQGFSQNFGQVLPYALAAGLGYGARIAQEKFDEYLEDGARKAREEFFSKVEKPQPAKTSS